jgi:hypothetical protein
MGFRRVTQPLKCGARLEGSEVGFCRPAEGVLAHDHAAGVLAHDHAAGVLAHDSQFRQSPALLPSSPRPCHKACMKRMILIAMLALLPARSGAEPTPLRLGYAAYAAGFNILNLDATIALPPGGYDLGVSLRSAGTLDVFISLASEARVQGVWQGDRARPRRYSSQGHFRGRARHTVITYSDGQPRVEILEPEQDPEFEPVPEALRAGSVDGFTVIAQLVHSIAETGRCDGEVRSFDGRRAARIRAETAGWEILPRESRSVFQGRALRCDFESQILAGLSRDVGPDDISRKPQKGSIWLAELAPGRPLLPVLMSVEARHVGHVNVYLTALGGG